MWLPSPVYVLPILTWKSKIMGYIGKTYVVNFTNGLPLDVADTH